MWAWKKTLDFPCFSSFAPHQSAKHLHLVPMGVAVDVDAPGGFNQLEKYAQVKLDHETPKDPSKQYTPEN